MSSKVAFSREGSSKHLPLPKPSLLSRERVTKKRRVSKTIKSAETVDTEDDQEEPILMEFTSATSHVTQSDVASSADIEEIKERRRRERKQKKQQQLEAARTVKACKSTVFYRTPAPIIVYYFPYITCLLYLLFLIKHVRTSG